MKEFHTKEVEKSLEFCGFCCEKIEEDWHYIMCHRCQLKYEELKEENEQLKSEYLQFLKDVYKCRLPEDRSEGDLPFNVMDYFGIEDKIKALENKK